MSLPVTEDTPPDMLAGSMDLNVVLPNGKNVKMSIQRSTPMMDLLVQVTTANRLSPGNHSIQAVGDKGVLPYKPSTPIGTLDAFTIKIVDKKLNSHKKAPQVPQSFLNTFRLQVNLPRSQLFVARVTPDITLAEILNHVCTEKNLDIKKYEFRNPGNPDEVLELDKTLGSYKIQELSLVNKNNRAVGVLLSSADILHVKSSKHRQNSMCDSSLSSGSLGSRSTSPVPVNIARIPPQPPIRKKRRPAPKPPQINETEKKEETKATRQALISHSRESSDSSGYHEASVLSESPTHGVPLGRSETNSPPDTLPRHSKLIPSQSFTNLTTIQPATRTRLVNSISNASLNSNGMCRKKRAAPPPPPTYHAATEEKMKSSTLPTSRAEERIISNVPFVTGDKVDFVEETSTKVDIVENTVESESSLIVKTKVEVATSKAEAKPALDVAVKPVPKPRTLLNGRAPGDKREQKISMSRSQTDSILEGSANSPDCHVLNEKDVEFAGDNLKEVKSAPKLGEEEEFASEMSRLERWKNMDTLACLNEDETKPTKTAWLLGDSEASGDVSPIDETDHDSLNWQYQLPPPPTDFRDAHSPNFTEFGTVTITPDIYKEEDEENRSFKRKDCAKTEPEETVRSGEENRGGETRFKNSKPVIMSELTNVLTMKEKSSSVTNLYVSDNRKPTCLSYSKSFTNELPIKNMKMSMYESFGAENEKYENEIEYKNYKNLEKSLSMECIKTRGMEELDNKDEGCRRSVAPVQKKIKVAKRSSSSINPEQRKSQSDLDFDPDGDNIAVLRQHFIDFLKEKKLTNDLNMKSLDVMRHILPQINGDAKEVRQSKPVPSVKVVDFKRKTNPLSGVKENVVIIEKEEKEPEIRVKEIQVKKEPKRYSYYEPPSINFATWGERPKTQVFIKDEDYVTEDKVTKKKMEKKPVEEAAKPIVMKKPSVIQFKKPGVKSHYEMFSALPKKKEVTSLTLIQMEDEEKKKTKKLTTEPSRVPVVCGAELKKEFREKQGNRSISVTEVNVEPEVRQPHSVSIYINSEQKKDERNMSAPKPLITNYFNSQRKTTLMPVVKGFRMIPKEESRLYCNGSSNTNSIDVKNESNVVKSQKKHVSEVSLPPPPPPPPPPPSTSFLANLKPVSARQIKPKTDSVNPRDQLMEDIRNFRGFNIKKSAQ